jgi:polyhydroxybutyrate depolymerase
MMLMRWALVSGLAAVVLAMAACGDSSNEETTGTATLAPPTASMTATVAPTTASDSPATGPDGTACGAGLAHEAGDFEGAITSGGIERTYILHVPPSYDGTAAVPLVINYHGFGSNARDQARYSRLPQKADEEGFIVVSPNGTGSPPRWTFPTLGNVDEAAFTGDLLDTLEQQLCIDPDRVYLAGMSNGAAITTFIVCALPERIAAIAPVAATAGPRACATEEPIPIVTFRATEDQCVPYEGGTSSCGMMLPVLAVRDVMALWGEHNGCDPEPVEEQVSEHVTRTSYGGCADGAEAVLYTTEGDGHTWPGSAAVPRLGPVTQEIDATDLMWEFFEAHPR